MFLNEVAVSSKKGLLRDDYRLGWWIIGEQQLLRFRCTGLHHCSVCVLAKWPWGLVHDADPPTNFVALALLAVWVYLAWCFRLPPQELALSLVGVKRQMFILLDHVHLAATCFSHSFSETVFSGPVIKK